MLAIAQWATAMMIVMKITMRELSTVYKEWSKIKMSVQDFGRAHDADTNKHWLQLLLLCVAITLCPSLWQYPKRNDAAVCPVAVSCTFFGHSDFFLFCFGSLDSVAHAVKSNLCVVKWVFTEFVLKKKIICFLRRRKRSSKKRGKSPKQN